MRLSAEVAAATHHSPDHETGPAAGHTAGHEEVHHRFALGIFLGATHVHSENEFTYGVEFAYNFHPKWSIGAVLEQAERESETTFFLLGVGWHPVRNWRLQAGIGTKDPSGHSETVGRLGLTYEWELKNGWFIKPYLAADFIEHEDTETVYGAYFGKAF